MKTFEEKVQDLCNTITKEQHERLKSDNLGCQCNLDNSMARILKKRKYTYINVGPSGKYMVENSTGNIYGIKGYGQVNLCRMFGTLDTVESYFWGEYEAFKK